jgi:hypothetical protein
MSTTRATIFSAIAIISIGVQSLPAQNTREPLTGKALIAADQTALANAKTDQTRAKNNYSSGLANKRQDFMKSKELKEAQATAAAASTKANQERTRVMTALQATDAHREAVAKEKAAQAKVDGLRQKKAPASEINDAATAVMAAGAPVAAMERKALESDTDYQAANDALVAANKEVTRLKEDFDNNLLRDPAIVALKKAQEDADAAVQKAQNKLIADQESQKK